MDFTKRCSRCGEEKPTTAFSPHKATRDKLSSSCRTCANAIGSENLKRRRAAKDPEDYERCRNRAIARLDKHIERRGDCLLWTGWTLYGYGEMRSGPFKFRAHRLAWEHAKGVRLRDSQLCVCHRCDVLWPAGDIGYRRCINPNHLFLGTRRENQADMAEKGRSSHHERSGMRRLRHPDGPVTSKRGIVRPRLKGEGNGQAKLTVEAVRGIRSDYALGLTMQTLAERHNVQVSTISKIVNRRRWAHIE